MDNIVILMSDGHSNVLEGDTPTANAAAQLKATGATVYTIAVSDSSNMNELNNINSDPNAEHSFRVGADRDYQAIARGLLDKLCQ